MTIAIQPEHRQHLTNSATWNNRQEVWKDADVLKKLWFHYTNVVVVVQAPSLSTEEDATANPCPFPTFLVAENRTNL